MKDGLEALLALEDVDDDSLAWTGTLNTSLLYFAIRTIFMSWFYGDVSSCSVVLYGCHVYLPAVITCSFHESKVDFLVGNSFREHCYASQDSRESRLSLPS